MSFLEIILPDQDGELHQLKNFKGEVVVVYFYPKDDTPGCTKEACSLRDNWGEFEKRGVKIVGVSKDSVESHKKFALKYNLPFTLLADPDNFLREALDYDQSRVTFVLNKEGKIIKVFEEVTPATHGEDLLNYLDGL